MKALILTGGQGTRLRPLTLTTLKPLLPIANLPFLNYPLSLLRKAGAREVILCTSSSLAPYREFVRGQKKLGTELHCSQESRPLGTGGAVKNAEGYLETSPFFVMNGDSLTNLDFSELLRFHKSKRAAVTLALITVEDPSQYGLVMTGPKSEIQRFIEKPSELDLNSRRKFLINAGIYVFEKEVLGLMPRNSVYSIERELFPQLLQKGWPVYGYAAKPSVYWMDIGTSGKYLQANIDVISKKITGVVPGSWTKALGEHSRIHPTAKVGKNVVIGKHCVVGPKAVLNRSVLLDHVHVGSEATIENCIIGNRCHIGSHAQIKQTQALGDHSRITPFSRL